MVDIPTVRLAVIGGSGFYKLAHFETIATVEPETPWGKPASPITIASSPSGFPVAFLARHGIGHHYLPSEVPNRANIAALKSLGVTMIVAFSAVGSLQEHIEPEDFVIPTQIIDRTKGIRPSTFFGEGLVCHAMFSDPFSVTLNTLLASPTFSHVMKEKKLHVSSGGGDGKELTLVCMEGPQFSTRAESNLYRSWGGCVINMSAVPESKLAREAEIEYSMVCMATDYDCWRVTEGGVSVQEVMTHVKNNTANAGLLILKIVEEVEARLKVDGTFGQGLHGSMKFAVMTSPETRNQESVKKLEYILPGYYSA